MNLTSDKDTSINPHKGRGGGRIFFLIIPLCGDILYSIFFTSAQFICVCVYVFPPYSFYFSYIMPKVSVIFCYFARCIIIFIMKNSKVI